MPRDVVPSTAFGQPNGNTPSPHRFSSTNQPSVKHSWIDQDTVGLVKQNGAIATSLRNRYLRSAHRVLGDIEYLAQGDDPGLAAREALASLTPEVRALMRDAEAAAGLSTPSPEDHSPAAGELDVRATAMAALELLRRAARPAEGEVIDVTPTEVREDGR